MNKEEFRQCLVLAFPRVRVSSRSLYHKSAYDDERRFLSGLSNVTWPDLSFDDCFNTHGCLYLLTPIAVVAYIPALLLHSWNIDKADVLLEFVLSWIADADVMHSGHQFSALTDEQRLLVCIWLHHLENFDTNGDIDQKHLMLAKKRWDCIEADDINFSEVIS